MTKVKALAFVLFAAGLCASYALAGNGHGGHGKGNGAAVTATTSSTASTSTGTTTTTETKGHHGPGKVTLCHRAGKSGRWIKLTVAAPAAKAHQKHGDVLPGADGSCPAPGAPTTTSVTTTDAVTTTTTP